MQVPLGMKPLSFTLLTVENNDYQTEQIASALAAAKRLGIDLQVKHTEHDAVVQGQQVIELLQSGAGVRPDGILFEPVGTPLRQAAKMAAELGVGWVVLNRECVDYMAELRGQHPAPMFSVTTSHVEVGRIQGEQIAHLLPQGGVVLYIQGPAGNEATGRRTTGMQATKPAAVEVRMLHGLWTQESAQRAVSSWLKLTIARESSLSAVAAQNDAMALGARKAFEEFRPGSARDRFLHLSFLGCDGLPGTGQAAVRKGLLTATIVIPPTAGHAVEVLASALRTGKQPAECVNREVQSYPALTSLKPATA
jgi:ribose transport system substrate-binding protein